MAKFEEVKKVDEGWRWEEWRKKSKEKGLENYEKTPSKKDVENPSHLNFSWSIIQTSKIDIMEKDEERMSEKGYVWPQRVGGKWNVRLRKVGEGGMFGS